MFEQATLTNGPVGARAWTTFLGLSSQVALVSMAVLAPMVFPQVLPTARFLETLAPPLPPQPPKPLGEEKQVPASGRVLKRVPMSATSYQPRSIPTTVYRIVDEPVDTGGVVGSPVGAGNATGVIRNILDGVSGSIGVAPPPAVPAPVTRSIAAAPAAIPRYKEGGNVVLGAPLHRSEPHYPQIARMARVSGTVELECVVGVDGHIHQVKVKSGNPLLIPAAVDAAWQWVYGPSKLNGVPIEIITMLTFSFKLN